MLRTPWPAALGNAAPVFAILMVAMIPDPSLWGFVFMSAGCLAVTLVYRLLYRVELTPEGLVLRWFQSRLVPWNQIGAVGRSSFLGNASITILDLSQKRTRYLPSPQSVFGMGSREVARAQALVEEWWIDHRDAAPVFGAPSGPA